jgi:MtN3 and saliva related transmembrane protein
MSLDTAFDLIGLVGSFIISVGLVPQVTKVYQTKSAIDFSYSFLAMYSGGLGLTVLYGVGENLWPIYIPCSMEFLGALMLLVMKLVYDKNPIVVTIDEKGERHHLLANVAAPRPVCKTCNCSCGGVTSNGAPASSARDTTTL